MRRISQFVAGDTSIIMTPQLILAGDRLWLPSPELVELLSARRPSMAPLALALRDIVVGEAPDANELICGTGQNGSSTIKSAKGRIRSLRE